MESNLLRITDYIRATRSLTEAEQAFYADVDVLIDAGSLCDVVPKDYGPSEPWEAQ